jgi:hypothetical protein
MSASALADEQGRKIFLGGLSFDAREGDLRSDFSKYGELEDVQLPMGDGGKHKGFAFLTPYAGIGTVRVDAAAPGSSLRGESLTLAKRFVGVNIALVPLAELSKCEGDPTALALTPGVLRAWLPRRANDMHKGEAGRVGILAGSRGFLGAAELACRGAIRAGAGLVTLLVKKDVYPLIAPRVPAEVMVMPVDDYRDVLDMRFDALAVGPGLGFDDEKEILAVMTGWRLPAVIDAEFRMLSGESADQMRAVP